MTKLNMVELRKAIGTEEFDHTVLSGALSKYDAVDQKVNSLLKSGAITRIKKGFYIWGPDYRRSPICIESVANIIFGPSCISLQYALHHHGLIPERVETVTSVTPKRDKEFDTPIGRFSYRYLNIEKYPWGIEQVWIDKTHPVLMASREKALCDYIVLNKIKGLETAKDARDFLEHDLRIDRENWNLFDLRAMMQLNKHYRSESIAGVMEVL